MTLLDWVAIEQEIRDARWEPSEGGGQERRVYVGTCFVLLPSGRYWSGEEADDERTQALEAEAEARGFSFEAGDDPCDCFVVERKDDGESDSQSE